MTDEQAAPVTAPGAAAPRAVALRAGWAVRGKPPGSYDEYRVTSCGGPDFKTADYAEILRHFTLGTPSTQRSGGAALPWITISEVRAADDGTRIGVALEDWTGEADGAGRPIAETRYLCVPYEALRGTPVSYAALYEALTATAPPFGADGLDLRVPPLDPARAAAALQRFGTSRVAAAAALLLDGPVTVTGAPGLTALDRLEFLDAVAALLPYGWRTRFSAATWDQSGNRNVSLAFARQVRDGTAELEWQAPRLPERDTPGRGYADMLADLFGERGRSHLDVIAHLGRSGDPLADAEPGAAVRILGALDWPVTVLRAVERGTHDPDDLRGLLDSGRYRELSKPDARTVLFALVREREPADVPLLRKCWTDIAGTAATHFKEVSTAVRGLVWDATGLAADQAAFEQAAADQAAAEQTAQGQATQGQTAQGNATEGQAAQLNLAERRAARAVPYFELAFDLGRHDELLAAVILPARRAGEDATGTEAAARVALGVVDPASITPVAPPWPRTLEAFASAPRAVCALMSVLIDEPPEMLQTWYVQLTYHLDKSLMQPFHNVLFAPLQQVDAAKMERLAEHGTGCATDLVVLASYARRLGLVLPGLAAWLTGRATIPPNDRTLLTGCLTSARPVEAADRAVLDGLLLWLGAPPQHVTGVAAGHPDYWNTFSSLWAHPMPAGRTDQRAARLAGWLRAGGWASTRAGTGAVLRLVRDLTARLPHEGLPQARAMIAARAAAPGLFLDPDYQAWWSEAVFRCPDLAKECLVTLMNALGHDADPGRVGRLCAEELSRGVPAERVVTALVHGPVELSGGKIVLILAETRAYLDHLDVPDAEARTLDLARLFARDARYGHPLRERAAAMAVTEIDFWLRLINTTATVAEDEVLLREEERDRLKRISQWALGLVKASKPGNRFFGGRS